MLQRCRVVGVAKAGCDREVCICVVFLFFFCGSKEARPHTFVDIGYSALVTTIVQLKRSLLRYIFAIGYACKGLVGSRGQGRGCVCTSGKSRARSSSVR